MNMYIEPKQSTAAFLRHNKQPKPKNKDYKTTALALSMLMSVGLGANAFKQDREIKLLKAQTEKSDSFLLSNQRSTDEKLDAEAHKVDVLNSSLAEKIKSMQKADESLGKTQKILTNRVDSHYEAIDLLSKNQIGMEGGLEDLYLSLNALDMRVLSKFKHFEKIKGLDRISYITKKVSPSTVMIKGEILEETDNKRKEISPKTGSGVVLKDEQGNLNILTNRHVISDNLMMDEDGQTYYKIIPFNHFGEDNFVKAVLIKSDADKDLALLRVLPNQKLNSELTPTENFRNNAKSPLQRGEMILATGSPLGFQDSVSLGVVSYPDRMVEDDSNTHLIQSDVSINQGNSGGGLWDMDGNLVGLTQISANALGDMSFSISGKTIKHFLDESKVKIPGFNAEKD